MDVFSAETRSRVMTSIGGKNTRPERLVRSIAHKLGLRFRLHRRDLPGTPDLVLLRHRTVIFVHGCFWHRHRCKRGSLPKTHRTFWKTKLEGNRMRDRRIGTALKRRGWRVVVVWECETKHPAALRTRLVGCFGKSPN